MNFKTLEGAMEIFKSLNCIGNENCIFVTFKDTNREGLKYGALGAVGGAIAGAAASFSNGMLAGIQGFDGMLINLTETGLGIIPLKSKKIQLTLKIDNMEPLLDRFVFVANENVESIIIKNFSFLNELTQPYIFDKDKSWIIKISRKGEDPHAIMIPYDFKWPLETICIKDAYLKFNEWGQGLVTDTDWYKYPIEGRYYE